MSRPKASDALGPHPTARTRQDTFTSNSEAIQRPTHSLKAVPIAIPTSPTFDAFSADRDGLKSYAGLGAGSQAPVLLPPLPVREHLGPHASSSERFDFPGQQQASASHATPDRHRIVSAPTIFSTSPRSPLSMSTSSGGSPPRRRSAQFPLAATAPRGSPSSPPTTTTDAASSSFFLSPNSRRRRSSTSLSTSAGSSTAAPMFGSLVGSFEHSLLSGRLSALPSLPLPFVLSIGVLGGTASPPSLKCPPHLNLPLGAVYYAGPDSSKLSSPYVGTVDLEAHYMSVLQLDCDDKRKLPKFPGYQVPVQGQLQLVVKNPNSTAVKLFLIPYDLNGLDRHGRGGKTFLRQKSYSVEDGASDDAKGRLRYAVHLQFCSPPATINKKQRKLAEAGVESPAKYYLHGNVRVVFASRALEVSEKLRIVTECPDGVLGVTDERDGVQSRLEDRFAPYGGPSSEWDMARRKAQERNKVRSLVGTRDDEVQARQLDDRDAVEWSAQHRARGSTPTHDPNGIHLDSSAASSIVATPFRSSTPFMPYADIATVALSAPFSFEQLSAALPRAGEPLGQSSPSSAQELTFEFSEGKDVTRPRLTTQRSGLTTTRPPSREEDCGR
ncbi:hypothetical protein ACM66B_002908 [Microbotryomycetes sp. NB124-2]